ncbi:E3 ubiquitin-protein ligase RGLG4-like [Quercus lobata]|uniref:E3 ubiquitin-protein ligase RGLG4-like n=1 Tax=Quercus lobata TaxID=97700 RepID=UPI001248178C|nr:E3 ubiquitin-protein ligase RGLG4-like [Quercus lobata]
MILDDYVMQDSIDVEKQTEVLTNTNGNTSIVRGMALGYSSIMEVSAALSKEGLGASKLLIGIDFTRSNEWTGKVSFNNRSLHGIGDAPNPYEKAISIIGKTLAPFDGDNIIACFGFGDETTHDQEVFSFHSDHSPCHGLKAALSCYRKITRNAKLAGPTSYAPVLLIIADGQVTRSSDISDKELSPQEEQILKSIVNARSYPLSIVVVRVADGPCEDMKNFGDELRACECHNFKMVDFTEIMSTNATSAEKEKTFVLVALMEIPFYKAAVELGILGHVTGRAEQIVPRPPPVPPTCETSSPLTCRDCSELSICPTFREPITSRQGVYI